MFRNIFKVILLGLLLFGFYAGYKFYSQYKERKRRATFYNNLVDTSSPNVTVLRDSVLVGYQNSKRTVQIYVPTNYDIDSFSRYPVMYFLDGQSAFNDLESHGPEWQIDEVINASIEKEVLGAIVVAINNAVDRDAEYTPFKNEDNPSAHGAEFAKWLTKDLKNWVDTNYRTKQENKSTTIGGVSRSGMMAYYILMAHPDVIGNALIQAPAMWVDYDRLMAMELTNKQLIDKKIMISIGDMESREMINYAKDIYKKFKSHGLNQNHLRFEMIPNEGHWNVAWRKSFAIAYPWLIKGQ